MSLVMLDIKSDDLSEKEIQNIENMDKVFGHNEFIRHFR
jgi:hypothetical protein